jgi:hypothetical protein
MNCIQVLQATLPPFTVHLLDLNTMFSYGLQADDSRAYVSLPGHERGAAEQDITNSPRLPPQNIF